MCPNREISMGLACVIPSLGLWTSISALGMCRAVTLGLVFDFVANFHGSPSHGFSPFHILPQPKPFHRQRREGCPSRANEVLATLATGLHLRPGLLRGEERPELQ